MVLEERVQYLTARGERATQIHDAPYKRHSEKDIVLENAPRLFKCQERSLSANNSHRCSSIGLADNLCRCFDCNNIATEQIVFTMSWSIGDCILFVKDDSVNPSPRMLEDGIELRGESYVHPTVSAKRLCKSSTKVDTVLQYLHRMMNPVTNHPRGPQSKAMCERDQDRQEANDDEVKPKEWYGWRDTFRIDNVSIDNVNCIEELADCWPMSETHFRALKALAISTHVYLRLDGATISPRVVETPLNEAPWLPKVNISYLTHQNLERPSILACIAHYESGVLLLRPDELEETLAIASGNSIFVIDAIISDPFETLAAKSVKRIIGNIGRTGICMLVAPFEPRIRSLGSQYNLVEHAVYDGKRDNNFKGTSLHPSFTDWTLPLEVKGAEGRTIDQEAYFVESVISVLGSGKWVADLDILRIDFKALTRLRQSQQCPGHSNGRADHDYTSLDSWEELLDGPMTVGIFRAHGNWAARLAAVSILSRKDQAHAVGMLGPESYCLECLGSDLDYGGLSKYESPLPSICID